MQSLWKENVKKCKKKKKKQKCQDFIGIVLVSAPEGVRCNIYDPLPPSAPYSSSSVSYILVSFLPAGRKGVK